MNYLAKRFVLIIWLVMGIMPVTAAQPDKPLPEIAAKTRAIVEAAHAFVSEHSNDMAAVQWALQTRPDLFDRDENLYIFMHCYDIEKKEAVCCGQAVRPKLVGKNMWHLRTPAGRLLFREIALMIERDGQGWMEYDWLNPYTHTLRQSVHTLKALP